MMHANKQQNHARRRSGLVLALVGLLSVTGLVKGPTTPASAQTVAPRWSYTGSLNTAGWGYTATLLPNGKVLVTGGTTADGGLASEELYDPSTGTWSFTGSLNAPRGRGYTATLLGNGKVLVAGGATAVLYDPATGAWSYTGSINVPRYFHTATLLKNGKVLIEGGTDYDTNIAELYDPATETWSVTGGPNTWRGGGHTATLLQNGKVLVAGGQNAADYSEFSTELYDPTTGTWSVTGRLNTARSWHTATLLPNGNVLVAGACNDGTHCATNSSAELYIPATGTWSVTGELKRPRFDHTATLLPDGQVLIAGGDHIDFLSGGTTVILNSSEIYNPATGHWKNAGKLNSPRAFHAATLLSDGKVLVVGGFDGKSVRQREYLRSAELYDPEPPIPAPGIIGASVIAKKLIVVGENFDDGAVILINGEEQKTRNDDQNPQTTLIGKKAGKKIKVGDHIQVRNPGGTVSEEFIFTGS
jgi:Galactose oxidase, central domain/Kelch motif